MNNTLYQRIKNDIARHGLTEELKEKIDAFYYANRLTEAEYKDLMGIVDELEEPVEETLAE